MSWFNLKPRIVSVMPTTDLKNLILFNNRGRKGVFQTHVYVQICNIFLSAAVRKGWMSGEESVSSVQN